MVQAIDDASLFAHELSEFRAAGATSLKALFVN
jgi:hypothetical protein